MSGKGREYRRPLPMRGEEMREAPIYVIAD